MSPVLLCEGKGLGLLWQHHCCGSTTAGLGNVYPLPLLFRITSKCLLVHLLPLETFVRREKQATVSNLEKYLCLAQHLQRKGEEEWGLCLGDHTSSVVPGHLKAPPGA